MTLQLTGKISLKFDFSSSLLLELAVPMSLVLILDKIAIHGCYSKKFVLKIN